MAKIRRELKNVVYNYTDAEVKVREATSNDPWGPSGTLMAELAEYTFHIQAYSLVMGMLWKRLNDHGKNWRHVYKALVVLDYLVKNGSQRVVQQCKDNMFSIETLKDFQYLDKEGKDQGSLIRERAKSLSALLKDDQKLSDERAKATKTKGRTAATGGHGSGTEGRRVSGQEPTSPGARFEPHINQSRPNAKDEEDLQLQMALRMSKEQADKEEELLKQEEESLRLALELSKQEASGEGKDLEEGGEEEGDNAGGGGGGDDDLLGLGDPWTGGGSSELPPSYDTLGGPSGPSSSDPWVPPVNNAISSGSDPFVGKDPFSSSPSTSNDPWKQNTTSGKTSPPFGGEDFSKDPWVSLSTTTSTSRPTTSTTAPMDSLPMLPPLDVGLTPVISTGTTGTTSDPYNFSAFGATLDSIVTGTDDPKKTTKVEEIFLGPNAGLVNLDSLVTDLPPPSSINPFGLPPSATPPTARANNPFDMGKAPAPSLQELQMGSSGFDPLPPPLLPSQPGSNINPFS